MAYQASASSAAIRSTTETPESGPVSLLDALKGALVAHQRGDLDSAEAGYKSVLRVQPNNADALQYLGVIAHARGKSQKAVHLIRKALKSEPANGTAHNNLASIYMRLGDEKKAEFHYHKALASPEPPEDALCNLGILQRMQGKLAAARNSLETAVKRYPHFLKAKKELAELLIEERDFTRAEPLMKAYVDNAENDHDARSRYGLLLQHLGRLTEAQDYLFSGSDDYGGPSNAQEILNLLLTEAKPSEATWENLRTFLAQNEKDLASHIGIGGALVRAGRLEVGLAVLQLIGENHGDNAEVWSDIGTTLAEIGRRNEGIAFLNKAVAIDPNNADVMNNLANVCLQANRTTDAILLFLKALSLKPDFLEPNLGLSRAYRLLHELDKSVLYARAALQLPSYRPRHCSSLIHAFRAACDFEGLEALGDIWENCQQLNVDQLPSAFLGLLVNTWDRRDARKLYELIRVWGQFTETHAANAPLAPLPAKPRGGKIRLGLLSSDLRDHAVTRFLLPVIQNYDHNRIEFYCYTPAQAVGDTIQNLISENVTRLVIVDGMGDREIAESIRRDDIDVLIELNGFTMGSHLAALAYRPAPVQMTWIGYPFTVGLNAVDYTILDRYAKPEDEGLLTEEALVMPEAWVCLRGFGNVPISPDLPLDRNGVVTFGSQNNPYKLSPKVIAAWAEVMKQVPGSRFLYVRPELRSNVLIHNLAAEFARHGVDGDRLVFVDSAAQKASHLTFYNEMDISLDTFPLTGGTTTCEALWMGVPVVSLVGPNFHQRVSYSVLMQTGLETLCTFDEGAFVRRAVELAGDEPRIRAWRQGLRDQMLASPLCDSERFVYQFQEMLEQVVKLHNLR